MHILTKFYDRGSLCIFDDAMNEVSSNATISRLFTRGRSHLGCCLVLMSQNIFPKGSQSRTISINAQYRVPFCNPRDSLKISILVRQLCPVNSKSFLEIYKGASHRAYGYLLVVLHNVVQMKFHGGLVDMPFPAKERRTKGHANFCSHENEARHCSTIMNLLRFQTWPVRQCFGWLSPRFHQKKAHVFSVSLISNTWQFKFVLLEYFAAKDEMFLKK